MLSSMRRNEFEGVVDDVLEATVSDGGTAIVGAGSAARLVHEAAMSPSVTSNHVVRMAFLLPP